MKSRIFRPFRLFGRLQVIQIAFAALLLAVMLNGGYCSAWAQAKKPLQIEDLYLFDGPHSVVVSPNGRTAVYIRSWIDRETKQERTSLWIAEGNRDKVRPLEPGEPDARGPKFSPDGKWIVFRSTRRRPRGWEQTPPVPLQSQPALDIWLLPVSGGSAIPLAGPEKNYGRVFNDPFYGCVAFSADGKQLVFVADDGQDSRTPSEIAADVYVVRPDQGEGYTGYRPAQIWVAELNLDPGTHASKRVRRLTENDAWYGDPQWSPDGQTIVVHANRTSDRESVRFSVNKNYDLWAIDVATKSITQLTSGPGPEVSPRFSPDGKRLACLSVPRKGPHADIYNLAIVTLEPSGPSTRIIFDHHGRDADPVNRPSPAMHLPSDCWDGPNFVIHNADIGTTSKTVRVDLRTGEQSFVDRSQGKPDTSRWVPRGHTFLNQRLIAKSYLVHWKNDDGMPLEGVFTVPPPSISKPPYKLILYPHGGPHGRSTPGFDFTSQIFAAHGYAVFEPNFRGSTGYGRKFLDADRNDFGGGDMRDILSGIDFLIREKLVAPQRQFVYGISYGGYMATWLVGHTDQFRAAVAQNAVTDLTMMWGLSDLQSWTEWEFGQRPWEVPDAMRDHSPLTHVGKVQTPTLILHSREDRRVPLPMGLAFYRSLRARQVPTQMVIYPDEGHNIRQPRHREDVLRRTLEWFNKHSSDSY